MENGTGWEQPTLEVRQHRVRRLNPEPATKACTKCKKEKPIEAFGWWADGNFRRRSRCEQCRPGPPAWKTIVKCANENCENLLTTPRRRSRFCSKNCREAVRRRVVRRKRYDLPPDAPLSRIGRKVPDGATRFDVRSGYVLEKRTGHHRAQNNWVRQHILVAEKKYGFPITYPDFTVDHINDDRTDNRPEHLVLKVGHHGMHGELMPTLLRQPELRAIAREVLAQYDD